MKKRVAVVQKIPPWDFDCASPSSSLSGTSAHAAIARNETATIFVIHAVPMAWVSHAPSAPAAVWLRRVATSMPATIGHGRRKRAARTRDRSCVLSPISPSATRPVETRNGVRYEFPRSDSVIGNSYLTPFLHLPSFPLEHRVLDGEHALGAVHRRRREGGR